MSNFNWNNAGRTFTDFGGQDKTLYIPKSGLPFFDVLRLYGAIELYVGLQQEVFIHDAGDKWQVEAKVREHRLKDVQAVALMLQKGNLKLKEEQCVNELKAALAGNEYPTSPVRDLSIPLNNPDSALKDGVRDTAAASYRGLETGYGKGCKVPFADALLAYAGQERIGKVDGIYSLYFLPVFEGKVDFSKVISPLRSRLRTPNSLCAQALALLALKTSLFAEGYAERLTAVVYNRVRPKASDNYSGIIRIHSTALGSRFNRSDKFVAHYYRTFCSIVGRAWKPKGRGYKATDEVEDALAHAYWLMQPTRPKHLSALITSSERQKRNGKSFVITERSYVKEVFQMTYGKWSGDHEAVRKFARAVASGIYYARQIDSEERGKKWYDEVSLLRSASTPKAFFDKAMILIEQGKKLNADIASVSRGENFDPVFLFKSIGNSRVDFETFRDLFRMYLVQEST